MNQTAKRKTTDVSKTLTKEERTLVLVEIAKELGEVEAEGYGRIVIDVQDGHIATWWKITSRTARQFRHKIKGTGGLTS